MDGGAGNDLLVFETVLDTGADWIAGGSGSDTIDLTVLADWMVIFDDGNAFAGSDAVDAGPSR